MDVHSFHFVFVFNLFYNFKKLKAFDSVFVQVYLAADHSWFAQLAVARSLFHTTLNALPAHILADVLPSEAGVEVQGASLTIDVLTLLDH